MFLYHSTEHASTGLGLTRHATASRAKGAYSSAVDVQWELHIDATAAHTPGPYVCVLSFMCIASGDLRMCGGLGGGVLSAWQCTAEGIVLPWAWCACVVTCCERVVLGEHQVYTFTTGVLTCHRGQDTPAYSCVCAYRHGIVGSCSQVELMNSVTDSATAVHSSSLSDNCLLSLCVCWAKMCSKLLTLGASHSSRGQFR